MRRRAFTLIELLVVIAIIAILAAILFPVFAQAKVAAKKAADLSNVKQLATSVFLYANDYDDGIPMENQTFAACTITESPGSESGWEMEPMARFMSWDILLNPYVKNYDILRDPNSIWQSATITYGPANGCPLTTPIVHPYRSLGANSTVFSPWDIDGGANEQYSVNFSQINQVSNLPLLSDAGFGLIYHPGLILHANDPALKNLQDTNHPPALAQDPSPIGQFAPGGTGFNMAYADSSARYVAAGRIGANNGTTQINGVAINTLPFAGGNESGSPSFWDVPEFYQYGVPFAPADPRLQ